MVIILLFSLFGLSLGANHIIDVGYQAIYPTSSYINAGDTITFVSTNSAEFHYITSVFPDFSAPDPSGPIQCAPTSGPISCTVNVVDNVNAQGFVWADLGHPDTASFGIVYVKRASDIIIPWTVFQAHPPASSNPPYAIDSKWPLNTTVLLGQRVVWDSSSEPLLNHMVLFTDRQWQASIGCPFVHPWVSNRNFKHFAWQFNCLGSFRYICSVHMQMKGTIKVCKANGQCPQVSDIIRVCPYLFNDCDS